MRPIFHINVSIIFCFVLIFNLNSSSAQDKWKLSSNEEGIQVYTRQLAASRIKGVRVVCNFTATPTQIVAAILDIKSCNEWVYHSKINTLIKQISPLDLIYYSEVEVPWPVENRDYVVSIHTQQNPQTKVITINSPCIPGYVPENKGVVRISHSVGNWTISSINKTQTRAEYILEVDPMGTIPVWLLNLFATKGPFETFRKLKDHVQKDVYKNAHFDAIKD